MRRWVWLIVALLVAGGAAVAVVATSSSGSTAHPLIVTANVTRQTLQDKVTLSGTLSRLEQRQVVATAAAQVSVVHVNDGDVVKAGQSILAVNGRDSVAVEGAFPFFRPLDVGDSGADVQQLNEILTAAGDNPGPITPLYTDQTRFALAQWQAAHGYPGVTPQKRQTVTVSLTQGTGYKVGPQSTAAMVIGPTLPAPIPPSLPATNASTAVAPAGTALTAVDHPGPVQARLDAATTGPVVNDTVAPAAVPVLTLYSVNTVTTKGAPATFIVYASSAPTSPLTFSVSTGGTAGPDDVLPPPGPLVIQAGATSAQVQIPTRQNGLVEPDKTLTVSLVAGSGYTVGSPATGLTTIQSQDVPKLTVSGGGPVAPGGTATVVITAEQAPIQDTEVDVQVAGDAVPLQDYDPVPSSFILPAGQTQVEIPVTTLVRNVIQPDRHVVISLLPGAAYAVGAVKSATVTILGPTGSSALPVLSLTSGTQYLQKGQPFAVTVGLSQALTAPLTVQLTYAGSAVPGVDYSVPAGTLTVPPGQTSLVVQVPTIADDRVQPNTILFVSLTPSAAYTVGPANAVATWIVNQNLPQLTITAGTSTIAAGGAASFIITADQPPAKDTSVQFQAVGTAQAGQDYEPLTGTAILHAGQTSVTVVLRTIDRNIVFQPNDMIVGTWPIRVGQVLVKAGAVVQPGAELFSLTDTGFTVTLTASASDRTRLKVGDQCTVQISGGDAQATGVISELDQNISTDSTTKQSVYKGKIQVSDLGAADGAAVSIDVVVQQKANVLTVPIAAVKQNGAGQDVVRVINISTGHVTEVPVKTGLSVDSYIEIESGLRGNEVVIVETDQTKG
jgi:multidrug efflux pump subunit AcrA (membrane-fusion protein)